MAEKLKAGNGGKKEKKKLVERGARFGRDFNLVVGSVALAGAFIMPPVIAAGLTIYAGINFAQAGGFEVARRFVKNREKVKTEKLDKKPKKQ